MNFQWNFTYFSIQWGFPSSVSSADMKVWDKNQCLRINRKNLYVLFLCLWSNVITRTLAEKFLMVGWNKISRWMRVQRASRARVKNFVFVWRYCRHLWHFIENWRIWLKPIGAASAKNWILFLPCKKLYFSLTWWFFSSRESGTCLQCPPGYATGISLIQSYIATLVPRYEALLQNLPSLLEKYIIFLIKVYKIFQF